MLYFGSFNPIHVGHITVAEYVLCEGLADCLWFVVSPHSPFKHAAELAPEADRLRMVEIAIAASPLADRMRACDVEFALPRPSYTIDTLAALEAKHPGTEFSLLAGGDLVAGFTGWKEWRRLLDEYDIYIYPRPDAAPSPPELRDGFIILHDALCLDVSSTEVRRLLASGEDVSSLLPAGVEEYIKNKSLWNNNLR
jgi:nicotinate-nucleotide adenylyltransferase